MHDLGLIHPLSCKINRMCLSEAGGQVEMQQHMNIAKYTSNRSVHNFGKLFFFKKVEQADTQVYQMFMWHHSWPVLDIDPQPVSVWCPRGVIKTGQEAFPGMTERQALSHQDLISPCENG